MVKRSILIITAILAVMVAMTGVASAYNIGLVGGSEIIPLAPGDAIDLGVELSSTGANSANVKTIDINIISGSWFGIYEFKNGVSCIPSNLCSESDVIVTVLKSRIFADADPYLEPAALKIKMADHPVDPIGTIYVVGVMANGGVVGVQLASRPVQSAIPEFPTVALPIAAVIGLVFFFQQRREQK